jgi:hypothetical protein|tara:strand:+ start:305 stop:526 length:222 start_codon:yes stop_codon:yes gene_type:complete
MKINKIVCLDEEVVQFLKTVNASSLINRLLLEHMEQEDIMSMTLPQLKAKRECAKLEKEMRAKQKELIKNANN